jgi:phosphatidylserine/phosphatidylglycerophosphate/cardiolipin synthase-like enzyme
LENKEKHLINFVSYHQTSHAKIAYLGLWRDYHLRLTGEGVQDLQKQFLHDWFDDTKQNLLSSNQSCKNCFCKS